MKPDFVNGLLAQILERRIDATLGISQHF